MKKSIIILLAMVLAIVIAGCGGNGAQETPAAAAAPALAQPAQDSPAATAPAQSGDPLVGTWIWMGSPYYVFESDGNGTMAGAAIRWTAGDGVVSICTTPETCGTRCIAPMEWYYEFEGDQLTLTSTIIAGMSYHYTRG